VAFVRKVKTKSGATAVQVARKWRGKIVSLEHLGSAHSEEELATLLALARQRLAGDQLEFFTKPDSSLDFRIVRSYSGLLWKMLWEGYLRLGFDQLQDEVFAALCIARMVEPTSKLDSLRVLADLGVDRYDKNHLFRCLQRVVEKDYRVTLSQLCLRSRGHCRISLLLYDVTTLYFEVSQEDDYRKPGLSKERRLEPQIIVGLLVDQVGFPLELTSFAGNTAETKTILPVIKGFRERYQVKQLTVVADAAMMSAGNLKELAAAGFNYIVGSRLQKVPYDIAEYQRSQPLTDGQLFVDHQPDHRIVYQYRAKRAALDIKNIEKQIAKARRIIAGRSPASRAKFVSVTAKTRRLNRDLIAKAYALAGVKGYVTNLGIGNQRVIDYYHQLFQVETSFRMTKSDLKARPIFHRKRDSIEAHLTVVFAALAMARDLEARAKISLKQLVKTLGPIRSGVVSVNGKKYQAEPQISKEVQKLLKKLSGH
jgi:transposase